MDTITPLTLNRCVEIADSLRAEYSEPHWRLNGTYFAPFNFLPGDSLKKLDHVATKNGCDVFQCKYMPPGELALWRNGECIARIVGITT